MIFDKVLQPCISMSIVTFVLLLKLNYCFCDSAVATFYVSSTGSSNGGGGGCGFADEDLSYAPYYGFASAGNQNIYKHGKGCGACYQVKCSENPACSGSPITVTITDECPDACNNEPFHFDLSVNAFGALAQPGQADALRQAGRINIDYQRVPCYYQGGSMKFKVLPGSNRYFLEFAIENVNGDGEIGSVDIKPANSGTWSPMQYSYGAAWKYSIYDGTNGPYSVRITGAMSQQSVVAVDAIPLNWAPGQYYQANVNF